MRLLFTAWNSTETLLALLITTFLTLWRIPSGLWLMALLFSWTLLILAIIDIKTLLLPDALTLPLMWLALLSNAAGFVSLPLDKAVWGAAGGYAMLYLICHGYRLTRKKEGMGLGDAKMLAALGSWLGVDALPWLLFLATLFCVAALLGTWLLTKRDLSQPFPFGPALALSGWTTFLWQYG